MSNAKAIAAVTATLRELLRNQVAIVDDGITGLKISVGPLDVARKDTTNLPASQINLFLYQTVVSAALSNQDLPFQVRPGETAPPPLALNLHFLLTAWGGETDDDALSHRVLGAAMVVLHSHPVLGRKEIENALTDNDLHRQFERVRITALPTSVEDLSKLWTMFQTPYRLSAAYEATVVLLDSRLSAPAPLPVLKRGQEDRGPEATGELAPLLSAIDLPRSQPAVRLGQAFGLAGEQLSAADTAMLANPHLDEPIELTPAGIDETGTLRILLPDPAGDPGAMSTWCPGFFTVALRREVIAGVPPISSNALSLALAPTVATTLVSIAAGTVTLNIDCTPRIREGQLVLLVFGDRQVAPKSIVHPADETLPTVLGFEIEDVSAGSYVVRLRVDGVDSIPVVQAGTPPVPAFDPAQTVTVP